MKEKTFNRGHFPAGTRVVIDTGMKPAFEANVIAVESYGYDSWIVLLDRKCELTGNADAYHIRFVKKIIKRGDGKENTFHYVYYPKPPVVCRPDRKSPNKYSGHLESLVRWKVSTMTRLTARDHVYDLYAIIEKLQCLCPDQYGLVCVNKKRFVRLIKQAMASTKRNRRKAQAEYDEEINRAFYEDLEGYAFSA
jgi:hypothetical protein